MSHPIKSFVLFPISFVLDVQTFRPVGLVGGKLLPPRLSRPTSNFQSGKSWMLVSPISIFVLAMEPCCLGSSVFSLADKKKEGSMSERPASVLVWIQFHANQPNDMRIVTEVVTVGLLRSNATVKMKRRRNGVLCRCLVGKWREL